MKKAIKKATDDGGLMGDTLAAMRILGEAVVDAEHILARELTRHAIDHLMESLRVHLRGENNR